MSYIWCNIDKKYVKQKHNDKTIDIGEDWVPFGPLIRYGRYYKKDGSGLTDFCWICYLECCGRIITSAKTENHAIRKARRIVQKEAKKCLKHIKRYVRKQGAPQGFDTEEIIEYCDYMLEEVVCTK